MQSRTEEERNEEEVQSHIPRVRFKEEWQKQMRWISRASHQPMVSTRTCRCGIWSLLRLLAGSSLLSEASSESL